jgi:hypothetical protein
VIVSVIIVIASSDAILRITLYFTTTAVRIPESVVGLTVSSDGVSWQEVVIIRMEVVD